MIAMLIGALLGQMSPTLTLDEAIELAQKNAFEIQLAQSEVERQRQLVAQNAAALGPRVVLGATYSRLDKAVVSNFGPTSVTIQPIDSSQGTAGVKMPIDISGNLKRQVSASKSFYEAQKDTLLATQSDTTLDVKRAYFAVLRAEAQQTVAEDTVKQAEEQLKNAQAQFDAGVVAKVDVLRFETQLSDARSNLISAQGAVQLAKNSLNNLIGRPIETEFEVAPITAEPAVPADKNELVQKAQATRPEVSALRKTLKGLGFARRAQEAGMNPSLDAGLNYTHKFSGGGLSSVDDQTVGTVQFTFPIFDSGLTRARVKAARQQETQAQIRLDQAMLGISLEVRQAITNLQTAKSRREVALKQVELAQENLRLANVRYQAGEGTQLEVIDAQTALTQAKNAGVAAQYDYLTAYAELQRAVGEGVLPSLTQP